MRIPGRRPPARLTAVALLFVTASLLPVGDWQDPVVRLPAGTEPMAGPFPGLPFKVRLHPYPMLAVDPRLLPYAGETPLSDDVALDSHGVRMFRDGDRLVDHPVLQAQHAIRLLNAYLIADDEKLLELARRHADRLLANGVAQGDALFFPYRFDYARHDVAADTMPAPWYSAMAQGQALSAFVRLYQATGDPAYREAADRAFASFLSPRSVNRSDRPWTVLIDADGYYWPEEYPAAIPDRTFNGVVFAAYGLHDYHRLTGSTRARVLFQATLTTVAHALPGIRRHGDVSRYCLEHSVQSASYHAVHIEQLQRLAALTGDASFEAWADALREDHDPADDV